MGGWWFECNQHRAIRCKAALLVPHRLRVFRFYPLRAGAWEGDLGMDEKHFSNWIQYLPHPMLTTEAPSTEAIAIPDFQSIMRPLLESMADGTPKDTKQSLNEMLRHFGLGEDALKVYVA